jgi:hypothetical protein
LSFGLFPLHTLAEANSEVSSAHKQRGLSLASLATLLSDDFSSRQCQVTGRLSRALFDEGCVFDGPDPDMPVKGLNKYLSASCNLFQHAESCCDLLGVGVVDNYGEHDTEGIIVLWRIEGVISLPWHPVIKPYFGATYFQRCANTNNHDDHSLITKATEWWSISAADAFLSTVPAWANSKFASAPALPATTLLERETLKDIMASLRDMSPTLVESTVFLGGQNRMML